MCLAQSAGQKPTAQLMEMQNQAPAVGGYVRQLLTQQPGDSGPVHTYVSMLRQLLTAVSGTWHGCGAFFLCVCVCVCVCVHACVCVCAWMRVCGWNGYWNKSQHRKLMLEKKILLLLLLGLRLETFWSHVASLLLYHWAILAPRRLAWDN